MRYHNFTGFLLFERKRIDTMKKKEILIKREMNYVNEKMIVNNPTINYNIPSYNEYRRLFKDCDMTLADVIRNLEVNESIVIDVKSKEDGLEICKWFNTNTSTIMIRQHKDRKFINQFEQFERKVVCTRTK